MVFHAWPVAVVSFLFGDYGFEEGKLSRSLFTYLLVDIVLVIFFFTFHLGT